MNKINGYDAKEKPVLRLLTEHPKQDFVVQYHVRLPLRDIVKTLLGWQWTICSRITVETTLNGVPTLENAAPDTHLFPLPPPWWQWITLRIRKLRGR